MNRTQIKSFPDLVQENQMLEGAPFSEGLKSFFEDEKSKWPELAEGHKSLADCEYKDLVVDGATIEAQYNAIREKSVVAKTDAKSIKERGCFLCMESLPPLQGALRINDDFVALCNPRPVFNLHFTVTHIHHTPQELKNSLNSYLGLAKLVSPEFLIFFNGAKCGASAPDHLHFQMASAESFRVVNDYLAAKDSLDWQNIRGCQTALYSRVGCDFIVCKGPNLPEVEDYLNHLFKLQEDSMVSIATIYAQDSWHTLVVLRKAHRPKCYFEQGDKRHIFGTATIELFGRIVVPYRNDFENINSKIVKQAFDDVVCDRKEVQRIYSKSIERVV